MASVWHGLIATVIFWRAAITQIRKAPIVIIPIQSTSRYLSKTDVREPFIATIDCVTLVATLRNPHVLHFEGGHIKPLPLNLVNRRTLVAAYGQDDEGWRGRAVEIFIDQGVTNSSGEVVGGIRLRIPMSQPTPPPSYGKPLPQRPATNGRTPTPPPPVNGHHMTPNARPTQAAPAKPIAPPAPPAPRTPPFPPGKTSPQPPAKPPAPPTPSKAPAAELDQKHRQVIDRMLKAATWEEVVQLRAWAGKIMFSEEQFTEQDQVFEDCRRQFNRNIPY